MRHFRLTVAAVVMSAAVFLFFSPRAFALASFARQTSFSCMQCHFGFPELTPAGRTFKLNGFTTSLDENLSTTAGTDKVPELSLLKFPPVSMTLSSSVTWPMQPALANGQSVSVEVPQNLNLWVAGQLASHFGVALQIEFLRKAYIHILGAANRVPRVSSVDDGD